MSQAYYSRENVVHLDGTHIFQTAKDRENENAVAGNIGAAWQCSIRQFGALSPVDWYAERAGRLVGVLELKSRPHLSTKYPTVFLNVRKWLSLNLASIGLGCPALFIVKFEDGIFWVKLADVDARIHRISGCSRIVKSHNDIEPIIEVNVCTMRLLVVGLG